MALSLKNLHLPETIGTRTVVPGVLGAVLFAHCAFAQAGLVAAYSFNEGTGTTVADASGNTNTGTISGATWTNAGKYGKALIFNGTNAIVTINNAASLQLTTGMTLEAWVNPATVTGAWRDVIYKGDDRYLLEGTTPTGARPGGGGTWGSTFVITYGAASLTANAWSHLAVTYDGAALKFYVNGVQASTLPQSGNIATSSNPLQIGGDSIYGQYFSGMIDEVRVYNVALTAAQIQTDMNTPIGNPVLPPSSACDLNSDQTVNSADVQLAVDMSLGRVAPCTANILGAGVCNVVVVQRVVNAVGGQCVVGVSPLPHSVTLSWVASTSTNVVGYNIYRGTASGGPYTLLTTSRVTGTTYEDTAVLGGQTLYYVATAVDSNNLESAYSNQAVAVVPSP